MTISPESLGNTTSSAIRFVAAAFSDSELWFGHGATSATDEAFWLIGVVCGIDFLQLDKVDINAQTTEEQRARIADIASRRLQSRKPIAYLLGEAWFAGRRYYVTEDVLVPRSPFAELIDKGFENWLGSKQPARMLDLCTGSGCIGIAAALAFPKASVDLSDISPAAIAVARRNIERHEVAGRVTAIESDLLAQLEGPYDIILSNPPYVPQAEYDELPVEYHLEPQLGLTAGDDGLSIAVPIMMDAADYLTDDGWLFMEVGNTDEYLAECFPDLPLQWLEFESGGSGVFAVSAADLKQHFS